MFKVQFTTSSLQKNGGAFHFPSMFHTFLRLQSCVQRGDELVSENLHLRTESAEVEEAEDRVTRWCWGPGVPAGEWGVMVVWFLKQMGVELNPQTSTAVLGEILKLMENWREKIHPSICEYWYSQLSSQQQHGGEWDLAISHICDGSFRFGSQRSSFVQKSL